MNVGDRTNLVRLLVVRDKNQDDAVFSPDDCFFTDGNVTPPDVYAQINTRNVECIYDKLWNLQDTSESVPATRVQSAFVEFNVPIRKHLTYNQTGNDDTILPRNMQHWYLIGVSDSAILPNPSLDGNSITWFKNIN